MQRLWDRIERSVDDPVRALAVEVEVRVMPLDDTERAMMLGRLSGYAYDREREALAVLSRHPGLELCEVCGAVRGRTERGAESRIRERMAELKRLDEEARKNK